MVRSLVIRQIFRILDVVLVIAIVVAGTFAVRQMFAPMPTIEVDETLFTLAPLETENLVQLPGAREEYNVLVGSNFFGPAGKWDPGAQPLPEAEEIDLPIDSDIAETELNLNLKGTIALEPGDPFSTAFIENLDNREPPRSFLIGQEIVENVILEMVYQREVILLNKTSEPPQRERLRMEDATDAGSLPGAMPQMASVRPSSATPRNLPTSPTDSDSAVERISVNREELIQEVFDNYASLSSLRPELYRDESGNVLGVTAPDIGKQPLAQKLGFQDNDVLQTVNNERIDSEEKIMEIMQKYQNANSFRIGIIRDGKPRVLNYRVD
jgi:type II secretory pathway component PulC